MKQCGLFGRQSQASTFLLLGSATMLHGLMVFLQRCVLEKWLGLVVRYGLWSRQLGFDPPPSSAPPILGKPPTLRALVAPQ